VVEVFTPPQINAGLTKKNAAELEQHGFRRMSVTFKVVDNDGGSFAGYVFFVTFLGPGGESATYRGKQEAGSLYTFPENPVWIMPGNGFVTVHGVSEGTPRPIITGTANTSLKPTQTAVRMSMVQKVRTKQVVASSGSEAADQVAGEAGAGVKLEIVDISGKVSGSSSTKSTSTNQQTYEVKFPLPVVEITVDP
jgi:hypothetical protein